MLSTTLLQIEPILAKQLNKETTEAVLNFLKNYKCGTYIYPGVIKRKFSISIEEIYKFNDALIKEFPEDFVEDLIIRSNENDLQGKLF